MQSEQINEHITNIKALAQLPNGGTTNDLVLQLSNLHAAVGRLQMVLARSENAASKLNYEKRKASLTSKGVKNLRVNKGFSEAQGLYPYK